MNDIRLLRPWQMTLWHGWRPTCPKGWKYYMQGKQYAPDSGPYAKLSADEKKKRLDAMVRIWQSDTEKRIEREGYRAFISASGLDEYRYMRFPEWDRTAVVGQVVTLQRSASGAPEDPALFSIWRHDPLLKSLPDWKSYLRWHVIHSAARRREGA